MSDEIYKAEHDLLAEGLPVINAMGVEAAAGQPILNNAVRAQLAFVKDQLDHYLPTSPRGWGDDSKMPHEWGSMDTYDDMRNSLRVAAAMMDELCAPEIFSSTSDDPVVALRELIVLSESGLCAVAGEVLEAAGLTGDDDLDILAKVARDLEKARGLEPNSLFPADN